MKALIFSRKSNEENKKYFSILIDKLKKENIEYAIYSGLANDIPELIHDAPIVNGYDALKSYNPDVIITLGGDGTILTATTIIRELEIPILGINLGRLGFLANIEQQRIVDAIDLLKAKKYVIKERAMIELMTDKNLFENENFALNDFTLLKRDNSSMIIIHTYIDGEFLISYWADGLIVSTPTGSTAYSLSCGGPIMFPSSDNFILTPVAPHNLNVRPVVVSSSHEITFKIEGRGESYLCTLDSRNTTITADTEIKIKKGPFVSRFITLDGDSYMRTIRNKLNWGLDKRN